MWIRLRVRVRADGTIVGVAGLSDMPSFWIYTSWQDPFWIDMCRLDQNSITSVLDATQIQQDPLAHAPGRTWQIF